jgi:hypothetical protein
LLRLQLLSLLHFLLLHLRSLPSCRNVFCNFFSPQLAFQFSQLSDGGAIPSRFILYNNVVRFKPSLAAAPLGPPSFQLAL